MKRLLAILTLLMLGSSIVFAQDDEPVEIVYWSMWNETEPQAQVIQAWIDAFEAENPNVTITPTWNGRQNQTLIRTALSSGTTIDLVDQDADQITGGLMREGRGLALNEYLDMPALDEADTAITEVFTPGVLDLFALDGDVFLWPYIYNTVQFWYNVDAFEQAGVEEPSTWEEFLSINQQLLDAGFDPIVVESDILFYQQEYLTHYVVRKNGIGSLLAAVEDRTGEAWRDPVFLEAAQQSRRLWEEGYIPAAARGYLWPNGQQTLAFGVSAMEFAGSWLPTELRDQAGEGFRWGAFNFPTVPDGVGNQSELEVALLAFMVIEETEHPDEVFEFLRFTMTEQNQQMMADEALVGSTHRDVEWAEAIADGAEAAANASAVFPLYDGTLAQYAEFTNNILYVNWSEVFLDNITPEEFVERMVEDSVAYWERQDDDE
jgi:raffinose/stachyose/melibiose transport system substrate-binding protein